MRTSSLLPSLALFAAIAALTVPPAAAVESTYDYDYYECYDAGFDDRYDDDWFYDHYDYRDACEYDDVGFDYDEDYGDYDYGYDADADVFDWEEDGVLD